MPSLHDDTVKVNEVPDDALTEKEHPVAVPEFEKSLLATVFTFCEKDKEYEIEEVVFVILGVEEVNAVTEGALRYVILTSPLPVFTPCVCVTEVANEGLV